MANDLYGELLARALQRRAPPGHFPAFVTPGEANLLRSYGGGVAPGGGQYMAGGIPAFFEYGGDYGGLGTPGYGGSAMGFEDFGFMHTPAEEDEAAWEGVVAAGLSGLEGFTAVDEGDMGRSRSDQMAAFLAARAKADKAAAQAKANRDAAIAQANLEARITSPAPPAPVVSFTPTIPQTVVVPTQAPVVPLSVPSEISTGTSLTEPDLTPAPTVSQAQNDAAALAAAIEGDTSAVSPVSPTAPGFTGTISEPGTESFFEESLEQDQTPYSGDTEDSGPAAQQAALSMAQHEVNTGRMSQAQAFSALESPIDKGGLGRFSPAVGWGINSETGLASFADLAALNAQDHQGYAINNPQPSEASILASQVFAQLNPTITNAVIGLAGFLPGTVGFAATIAGLVENKGLMNIPAVRSIPGVSALSDALAGVRTGIGDFFSPITDPIGQALSAGQQAVADALSGITGTEESAGFDDAGEVDGGAPDIEIVPDVTTDTDVAPAPPVRTFADVDDETRRRILANIISGLQRTGRPTEGVTAFGPLFT